MAIEGDGAHAGPDTIRAGVGTETNLFGTRRHVRPPPCTQPAALRVCKSADLPSPRRAAPPRRRSRPGGCRWVDGTVSSDRTPTPAYPDAARRPHVPSTAPPPGRASAVARWRRQRPVPSPFGDWKRRAVTPRFASWSIGIPTTCHCTLRHHDDDAGLCRLRYGPRRVNRV